MQERKTVYLNVPESVDNMAGNAKIIKIKKRDGRIVDFDKERIALAIWKAAKAVGGKDKALADALADTVVDQLEKAYTDGEVPGVEEVQDMVEKVLIEGGYAKTAKAFIIYRAKRSEEREKMKAENVQKSLSGELKVKKRDGSATTFDISKVKAAIVHASTGYENDISAELISKEVVKNIYDGISTTEIETALVLASSSYIERDPAYNVVSARLFLQKLYNEASQKSISESDIESAYRKTFISGIKKGVAEKMLDAKLLEFDLQKLANALEIDRDSNFQYLGIQTLYERYFLKIDGIRFELPQSFWMRIAMGLSINEKDRNGKALEFYELLSSMRFTSSTPTLFHSGTTSPQLSSCYLTTVMDDLKHIFKSIGDNAEMSKWSGGLGNDWSNIRATGSWIKSTKVESQGVVPFLKIANDVTVAINRSGKRRGATCAYLETWHLDIEDFLDLRKNTGDERRRTHDMNTSNWIPDLFMKRVLEDGQWTLFSPEEVPDLHHIYGAKFEERYNYYEQMTREGKIKKFKTLSAQKLWKRMLSMLFETGHPWITFKDPCNIRSPQDHAGVIHSSNLCTEITLNTSADETAVCNLGSINLERHTHDGKIDYAVLSKTIKTAVRMLDNVIDINFYPTIEGKTSNMRHRPIGLGIMGFQDTLFKLDMNFDSEEAVQFSDRLMEFISYHAIFASSELAKERGPYETYKGSKWDRGIFPVDTLKILEDERGLKVDVNRSKTMEWGIVRENVKKYGMRNSNTMAIAPTATIANIDGCYPSIEPIYKNIYVKANISGEFTIVNSYLIEDLKKLGAWNQEMLDQLKYYDGNLLLMAGIPQKLKDKHKETFEIEPQWFIRHAAVRGKWIDQSQSLNLFMKGVSGKSLTDMYMYAWKAGLKTTYYLRTLAASQIEKSTLDANKFGFTQKREYHQMSAETGNVIKEAHNETSKQPMLEDSGSRIEQSQHIMKSASAIGSSGAAGSGSASGIGAGSAAALTFETSSTKPLKHEDSHYEFKACRIDDPDCESCQ